MYLRQQTTLRIGNELFDLNANPIVMGILNLTPDSFHEGSRVASGQVVDFAGQQLAEGAQILDLGGLSTRPGAEEISASEELDRLLPALETIRSAFPQALISVDTYRTSVALQAIKAGAHIINDVHGSHPDHGMPELIASTGTTYILMHSRGTAQTMQQLNQYHDLVADVIAECQTVLGKLHALGHYEVVIDPGFGFAKSVTQNFRLLQQLNDFALLGCPILAGLSRKSMIWRTLGLDPGQALNGTTALNMVALQKGARILRVHDVKPAVEVIKLWQAMTA